VSKLLATPEESKLEEARRKKMEVGNESKVQSLKQMRLFYGPSLRGAERRLTVFPV